MAPLPRVCIAPTHILYVLGARLLHPPHTHNYCTCIYHVPTTVIGASGSPEVDEVCFLFMLCGVQRREYITHLLTGL